MTDALLDSRDGAGLERGDEVFKGLGFLLTVTQGSGQILTQAGREAIFEGDKFFP